jgi:hypothetical protein
MPTLHSDNYILIEPATEKSIARWLKVRSHNRRVWIRISRDYPDERYIVLAKAGEAPVTTGVFLGKLLFEPAEEWFR